MLTPLLALLSMVTTFQFSPIFC